MTTTFIHGIENCRVRQMESGNVGILLKDENDNEVTLLITQDQYDFLIESLQSQKGVTQ